MQDTSKECLQDHITQAKSEQGRKEKRDQLLGVVVNEPNPVATWNLLQASQSLKISTQLHNPFVCWTSIQLSDFFSEKQALIRDMILLSLNLPNAADFTPAIYECFLSYTSAANNSSANTDNHLLNHVKDHHVITPIYSALKPVAECLKNTELKKLLAQSTQPTTRQYQTIAMCLLYKSAESININVYATYNQVEFSFFESLQTGINAYKTQLLAYTEIRIQENLHIPLKNICNEISNYIDIEKQILKREELFNTLINTVGLPTQIANNFVATTESILKKYFALPSQTDFLSYWKNNFQTARKEHSQTQFETERLFYRLTDQFPPLLQDALNTIEQAILQNVQSAGE